MFLFVRFPCDLRVYQRRQLSKDHKLLKDALIITVHLLAMSADKYCKIICLLGLAAIRCWGSALLKHSWMFSRIALLRNILLWLDTFDSFMVVCLVREQICRKWPNKNKGHKKTKVTLSCSIKTIKNDLLWLSLISTSVISGSWGVFRIYYTSNAFCFQ